MNDNKKLMNMTTESIVLVSTSGKKT